MLRGFFMLITIGMKQNMTKENLMNGRQAVIFVKIIKNLTKMLFF